MSMGRHANMNPVPKRSIQVSETFWTFMKRYRNETEPMYSAMDRLLGYYLQSKDDIVQDGEQKKRTIAKLYERIHELEQKSQAIIQ